LYADDVQLYLSGDIESISDCIIYRMNLDLESLHKWTIENGLNCDVFYSKISAGLHHKLQVAFNSCARYVYGVSRRDNISDYANSLLGRLTPYYSVSEYAAKCTILSQAESRVTCMTRSSLVARITMQQQPHSFCSRSYLVELSAAVSKKGTWRWEVHGKVSFVHRAANNLFF
jgi:hypothetical protein